MLEQEIKHPTKAVDFSHVVSVDDVNEEIGMPRVIQEVDEKTGRLVSKVVFEITPIEKLNEGLRVDDFALEVLLANGYEPRRVDNEVQSFDQIDAAVKGAEALADAHKKIVKSNPQNSETV